MGKSDIGAIEHFPVKNQLDSFLEKTHFNLTFPNHQSSLDVHSSHWILPLEHC